MPALLIHMTLAEQMLDHPSAPPELARAGREDKDALILGSVLPDLPYHAHFAHQVLRHLTRQQYLLSEWGDIFHTRGTGRLPLAMLKHAVRSHLRADERRRVLALVAGYLCHHSVDRVVHPVIKQMVDRHLERAGVHPTVLHARIERYQNLLYHRDLLGRDMLCTPFPRLLVGEMAGAGIIKPGLDSVLWEAFRGACIETHGRSPSERVTTDWLWGITAYGHLMSSPLGRVEQLDGDVEEIRTTYYQGPDVDLETPLKAALEATSTAWKAAEDVLRADRISSEVQDVFLRNVPDVDLATGA